ncbi:MAG: 3-hydroxyacyl-CoA dehydrogenase [Nitrospinae bacterium CG11_big_fil_rev_8_21_14_0_20_56_8]|nr:MAG: 3-hydroxyacyl-CoA dehydrogenase [Nitrospinae bacterium CG11_big_fil_rev_8_21_14_0_20_56_8]
MTIEATQDNLIVGVVGAGAMGRGIAQVAATGGCTIKLFDTRIESSKEAVDFIDNMLGRAVEKNRMTADDAKAAMARIEVLETMSGFADCHVIIEAATENLDIKRKIFSELESIVGDDVILASNTSSLSVTTIASSCQHPERVAGFHFFNPVPLMKLVEVIDGVRTAPDVADFLFALGARMGREPVRVADAPGFLVNQVGRGYTIEAAHLNSEGVADYVDVDRIMRDAAGFRMGPFELLDLTALDVTHPATKMIYEQFYHEARYRPSTKMNTRMEAGLLGRKTKQGYYAYQDGKQAVPEEEAAPEYDGRAVWVSQANPETCAQITELLNKLNAKIDNGEEPGEDSLIIVAPLGIDATTAALEEGLDPEHTVALDTLFGLDVRRTVMKTPVTDAAFVASARGLLTGDGVPVTVIRDSAGFVTQRILAMIVNIGCSIAQSGTATPLDIDKAVTMGLGYPHGPLAFGDFLGADRILEILISIFEITGDPRYRPTPWLRRRALLGESLLTPES